MSYKSTQTSDEEGLENSNLKKSVNGLGNIFIPGSVFFFLQLHLSQNHLVWL